MSVGRRRAQWLGVLATFAVGAQAEPWLAPGDAALRSDIQVLADAGILRGPVTTWPISWPDVARDVLSADPLGYDAATSAVLARVRQLSRAASQRGFAGLGVRVAASHEPSMLREFADAPREEGEATLRARWLGDHLAVNLQGTYAVDPDDGKELRADGSFLGVNFGNFMLSAGYMERWWGPGWDNSLILSTNARPIPSLTLERNYTDPFKTRWLSWIGPWRASIATGRAETHDIAVPGVRFFAARVNFRPRPWLEIGLTRTAQWCGGGRGCNLGTFADMFLGNDNQEQDGSVSGDQPGNQMAGYDLRFRSPWRVLPMVLYTQWIGEDEAGNLPSKFLGLFGLETWGSAGSSAWRMRAEYSDTACNFSRETPEFDCAYRNTIYPQGYTYRGRSIGSTMDNDGRMYALGGTLTRANGDFFSVTIRRAEINRDGGVHSISEMPLDVDNVELRYAREFGAGKVSVGLAYEDPATRPDASSSVHGFVTWQQGF